MRRLMLMRHAKSDWSIAGQHDHERPLSARGRKAAPLMGLYMAQHRLMPDAVLVSTAVRAQATWSLVAPTLDRRIEPQFDRRLYGAAAAELLAPVRETALAVRALLVIGHNPGLQDLARLLAESGDADARLALMEKFPTAALAVIDFPVTRWSDVAPRGGRLERFIAPRMLEK